MLVEFGRKIPVVGALALLSLCLCACESIKARYVDPAQVRHGECIGGAPLVVERNRWLKLTHKSVTTKTFASTLKITRSGDEDEQTTVEERGAPQELDRSTKLEIEQELVPMAEVYSVDFMRPFAGSSNHSIEYFDGEGHPKKLAQDVTDETLKQVLEGIPKLAESFAAIAGDEDPEPQPETAPGVFRVRSAEVVKIEYYDLYDLARGNYTPVKVIEPGRDPCAPPCPPACPPAVALDCAR